jgi:hypothetical protein
MAITSAKRELEKKKQEKRLDKQMRKEKRKSLKTLDSGSLENMTAYVDENGVISDTPPDNDLKNG